MAEFVMKGCSVNAEGHLTLDGVDTVEMAKKHGTPLYLLSEDTVRNNCRTYVNAVRENFGEGSYPCFASKALSFKGIYSIVGDEGMGSDAVSAGELYTANAAGFDMSRVFFHGNNKTEADMRYAIQVGTGWFVVDNTDELEALDRVGIGHLALRNYQSLSEGEKQLCMIARSFVSKAKLFVLDEPESSLDFKNRHKAIGLVCDKIRADKSIAVVCLHEPSVALQYCHRLVLIEGGRCIAQLSPQKDSLEAMEEKLKLIYGDIALACVQGRIVMLPK